MPTSRAIALAVRSLSPVSITTSMPRRWSASIALLESGLTVSATATRPALCRRRPHTSASCLRRRAVPNLFVSVSIANAAVAHQLGVAEKHVPAVDTAAHAVPGNRGEVLGIGEREPALLGALDDRLAQRMLGARVRARRPDEAPHCRSDLRNDYVRQRRFAAGDRAGLVEDDRVQLLARSAARRRTGSGCRSRPPCRCPR